MHKVNRLQIYLILAAALALHLTVLDQIRIFGARPDLILILVIFFGLFLGRWTGLETGLIAGLGKDLFALDFFGTNAATLAMSGYLAGVLGSKLSRESKKTQSLLTILLTALSMTLHFILVSIFLKRINLNFGEYLAASIIPTSAYTTLLAIPAYMKLQDMFDLRVTEEYL